MVAKAAVAVAIVAAVIAVYAPVRGFEFVNFDDPLYVGSPLVRAPLDASSVGRLLVEPVNALWHPLAVLSHALDHRLFGDWAGGHHLTSVALHAASAVLLFLFLTSATGALWPSAFVAAAFALHPLRVESVAWVAERKDVLSALLGFSTLLVYLAWVRRGGAWRYAALVVSFVLALAAKPMLVTLPVVLLLLDAWPLGRLRTARDVRELVVEKLPLLALAGVVGLLTIQLQHAGGAVVTLDGLPLAARLQNALLAVPRYLVATAWPVGLAPFYPYAPPATASVALAAATLLGASAGAIVLWPRAPWLLVGWGWYLVMLAPVSGILQSGSQAWADRFGYLPLVGIAIAAAWSVSAWCARSRTVRLVTPVAALALLLVWGVAGARQVAWWRDSATLFARTLEVTRDNYLAHNNLGEALAAKGRASEAESHYAEAVRLNPSYAPALNNQANALARRGETEAAMALYRSALASRPHFAEAHNGLGVLLVERGDLEQAIEHYGAALATDPGNAAARVNLANALRRSERFAEATAAYRAALALRPDWNDARRGLGASLAGTGDLAAAGDVYRAALERDPSDAGARAGLAQVLLAQGRREEALALAAEARRAGDAALAQNIEDALAGGPEDARGDR